MATIPANAIRFTAHGLTCAIVVSGDTVRGYVRAPHLAGSDHRAIDDLVECMGEDGVTHADANGWVGFYTHTFDWEAGDLADHLSKRQARRLAKAAAADPFWNMAKMTAEVQKLAEALAALPAGRRHSDHAAELAAAWADED